VTTFLLDTNACVEYLRNRNVGVVTQIQSRSPMELRLCSVVVAESFYGAFKSPNPPANLAVARQFISPLRSLPFDDKAAEVYGQIRSDLERQGRAIGPNDTMIAAIAISNGLTLVTHNTSEFSRVPGLRLADWRT
jgi:tRNA(fMet)-specific endonuclease VapC